MSNEKIEKIAKQKVFESVACGMFIGLEFLHLNGQDAEMESVVKRLQELFTEMLAKNWGNKKSK